MERRPMAELNLVPYIDLLTCMVSFLLITAAWTQLASLNVTRKGPGEGQAGSTLVVLVDEGGFNVVIGTDRQLLPRSAAGYDFTALASSLARVKAAHPDKNDAQVASDDGIPFETLVGAMDALLGAGFPDLSLIEAGSASL
jgi:biopolymer transport protein ExbD